VRKTIHVAGTEDKAATKLKGILPELMLMMTCDPRAFAALGVITTKKMQKVCRAESRYSIDPALLVDQQRKGDSGLLAKHAGIMTVTQSDGGQRGSFAAESLLAFAQLRDMFAAKDSSIMPKEYDHSGTIGPKCSEPNFPPIDIRKHDLC
jgi:hypothetical protein